MRWPWQHRHKKQNIAAVPQTVQGIQLSSSAVGLAIPLVYGQARVASRLIHYKKLTLAAGNFFGLPTGSDNPEAAALAMAVCEGPITGYLQVWDDKDNANAAALTAAGYLLTFLGTLSQSAWGFLTTNYPGEAVPYELTAYVANPAWPAPNGSVANYSWEVQALLQWGAGIVDSNPKDIVNDFLTDVNHGVGIPSALIASLTVFRDYCTSAGIFLSPVFDTQRSAAQHLQELLAVANSEFVWSDGKLKIVPYGDQNLSGNGATYTAPVTPAYNLTDDDFMAGEGEDPVKITRRPQSDVYNMVQVEFDNRAYQYNGDIAEAKDQNSIELYTLKPAPVIKAPFIKDAAVARLVAQLALQRQIYLRNTYEFTLPFRYVLLEPMDLVTLTDSILGLNATMVRLTQIDENEDGSFTCQAEDWIQGVSTAPAYGSGSSGGFGSAIPLEKRPKMPEISCSFDRTGQAILNLSGDSRTVKHIYVVRTDRLPTLAETRAGTTVNFAGQSNIATGASVISGAQVFVGDLAYNAAGTESALNVAVFTRGGVDVDVLGRIKRANPFDDGKFAPRASDAAGGVIDATVTDSTGSEIRKAFHKPAHTDPDNADSVPGGSVKRIPLVGGTDGSGNIDLGGTAWVNKHLGNMPDDAVSDRRAATANQTAGGGRAFTALDSSSRFKRANPFDDTLFGFRATENDGSTKSSAALAPQGSIIPTPLAASPFSYASGGAGSGAMWIAWSWSTITLYKPDGTTIAVPASSSLATPPAASLSQVLAGALGARTRFARIGYAKNGMIYRVGAEASFAISANNVLKITSPGAVAGYDGWIAMVGSATNAEKVQSVTIPFGTDWTEPVGGFDTTGTAYNNASWPNAVIATGLTASITYFFYPWYDLPLGFVVFPDTGLTARSEVSAAAQNADLKIGLTNFTAMSGITPAGAGSSSGTGGGSKYL